MPLDPDYLLALERDTIVHSWNWRDAAIYALGLGYGDDPLDKGQLRFLDQGQSGQLMPAMVNVLGYDGAWLRDPKTGVDYLKVVHGEQDMEIHAPLPIEGTVRSQTRITHLADKGEGKGGLIVMERKLCDADTDDLLATIRHTIFCRGAGGFGGKATAPSRTAPIPQRDPDGTVDIDTPAQLALIYRLSGDLNPLHADPGIARKAGFERPILHGLATFGIACRALMAALCDNEAARVKGLAGRFSAPVFPGESLAIDFWNEAPGLALCRVRVPARNVTVLDNARFEYAAR